MKKKKAIRLGGKTIDPVRLCGLLTIAALCLFLAAGAVSHGDSFLTNYGAGWIGAGMDFLNSLAEAAGGKPYTQYGTLYPPLTNLFFYILGRSVPESVSGEWASTHEGILDMRGTANDLRAHQAPMVLFIFFILISVIALYMLVEHIGKENGRGRWLAVSSVFSFGVLFAYERGNIILIALALTLFFVFFYNDENSAIVRELALVALALAAGLKIYPAVFGLLLLKEKEWKRAGRAILYGLMSFILPFLAFEGLEGMRIFFKQLIWISTSPDAVHGSIGVSGIMIPLFSLLGSFCDVSARLQDIVTWVVKLLIVAMLLTTFFLSKSRWRQYLDLTLLLVLFQTSYYYTLSFFLIPFIAYCRENEKLEKSNIAAFIFFMIVLLPYPAFTIQHMYSTTRYIMDALAMGAAVILRAAGELLHHDPGDRGQCQRRLI